MCAQNSSTNWQKQKQKICESKKNPSNFSPTKLSERPNIYASLRKKCEVESTQSPGNKSRAFALRCILNPKSGREQNRFSKQIGRAFK